MVVLKLYELSVNQESISYQTKKELVNLWLSIARSYLKNNGFDVSDIRLLNNETCQQFKAHQEQVDEVESYVLNFYTTGRIVITTKLHRNEILEKRIPTLEKLYGVQFKIKAVKHDNNKIKSATKKNQPNTSDIAAINSEKESKKFTNASNNTNSRKEKLSEKEEKLESFSSKDEVVNFDINKNSNVFNESNTQTKTTKSNVEIVETAVKKNKETHKNLQGQL